MDGSTHACATEQCGGGVARNMAEALWRMRGGRVRLLTAVGDDADGRYLADIAPGLLLDGCVVKGARTPTYAAIMDVRGECLLGLGDMALHNHISPELVDKHLHVLEKAPLVVLDGNAPQATIDHVLQLCNQFNIPAFFEPTDRRKAIKALHSKNRISYASPNLAELRAMARFLKPSIVLNTETDINDVIKLSEVVSEVVDFLVVTLGAQGVVTVKNNSFRSSKALESKARLYHIQALDHVENVSGAGDCFASGFIHGILSGLSESQSVTLGFEAAKCALLSRNTVPNHFDIEVIKSKK